MGLFDIFKGSDTAVKPSNANPNDLFKSFLNNHGFKFRFDEKKYGSIFYFAKDGVDYAVELSTCYSNAADEEFGDTGVRGTIHVSTKVFKGFIDVGGSEENGSWVCNEYNHEIGSLSGCFAMISGGDIEIHSEIIYTDVNAISLMVMHVLASMKECVDCFNDEFYHQL